MREAASMDDFVSDPFGSFVLGRNWLYFCTSEDLSGYLVWGRPEAADFDALSEAMPATHMPWSKPHPTLVDVSHMDGLSAGAFERIIAFTMGNLEPIHRTVTKIALVRSTGVGSAIASGFFSFIAPFVPFTFCSDHENALAWLDRRAELSRFEELVRHRARAIGASPIVTDFRRLLESEPDLPSLAHAARRLGVSERTLQRRLAESGTNLRREAAHARVRTAEMLLVETECSVTEIALRVGCSSTQHFSTLFRSVHDTTPSAWRALQRRRSEAPRLPLAI